MPKKQLFRRKGKQNVIILQEKLKKIF